MNPSPLARSERTSLQKAQVDVVNRLLEDKRSPETRRAYAKDLRDFFKFIAGVEEPTQEVVAGFLGCERYRAIALVLDYKAHLLNRRKLSEATVNRRLAAIKSLVRLGNQLEQCSFTLTEITSSKVVPYRDTTGITKEVFRKLIAVPDRTTLKGKRDYAILRLLWDNVLRRGEIVRADIGDLDAEGSVLAILGKGRGNQKEAIRLSRNTLAAIVDWLLARKETNPKKPLFIALDPCSKGHRLSGTSIYNLVNELGQRAGIAKKLSPHRIRHSGITAALDATNGDVRKVQKLSRHANLNTLMIYDDHRQDAQGEISELLSELV
ncbi:MAG: Tyrosine recombinase XerC (plasmid) [Chroococcopsis gigantea SAG 12.99]|nr:Tyrosine recombinase XerC [Chroococcopsis gigantea SAG 12.99]